MRSAWRSGSARITPLRDLARRTDRILTALAADFARAYSHTGRPGVPPGRLLKALLRMTRYSIRSERQLCERIDTDLLFRWFLDLHPSDAAFAPTTFTHNRDRLRDQDLTRAFFAAVVSEALTRGPCGEHFSVDGTLIESFASAKSFRPMAGADAPSAPAIGPRRRTATGSSPGMSGAISAGRSGPMPRTGARPIRGPGCIARARAKGCGSPT